MEEKETDLSIFMADLREDNVIEVVNEMVREKADPNSIIDELQRGLTEIGKRFENDEYFVPDLIFAGEIMKETLGILKPLLVGKSRKNENRVVMGTVYGDVHDLGKDIAASLLAGSGYEVIDLGVNVPHKSFVTALEESGSRLVGMSALLTMSFDSIKDSVKAIEEAGLRQSVSIMIGGQPVTEKARAATGADFYAKDALAGVRFANRVYGRNSRGNAI